MFEFVNSIEISCPIETVFAFAADLSNVPKWNYYVRQVIATSGNPGHEGATYRQVRINDAQHLRIIHLKPNSFFAVETTSGSKPGFRREMTFEGDSQMTRIVDRWHLELGLPRLLEPLAVNRARNGVKENLVKLKTLLETGTVVLQDGRIFTLG